MRIKYYVIRSGDWLFESQPGGWLLCVMAFVVVCALCIGSALALSACYVEVVRPMQGLPR